MALFGKDETTETEVTTETVETVEIEKPKKTRKRAKKETKKESESPSENQGATKSQSKGPQTMATTTLTEFYQKMAIYRNQTVPVKYNQNPAKKLNYITPMVGYYQIDLLDPYEVQGVENWIWGDNYATRYPIFTDANTFTSTNANATIDKDGVNFTITAGDDADIDLTADVTSSENAWHLVRFDYNSSNPDIVLSISIDGESFPIAGGITENFSPEYDDGTTRVTVPVYASATGSTVELIASNVTTGDVFKIRNMHFSYIRHNVA